MKITRAMKKVARLKGEIRIIKERISNSLNTLSDNEAFAEDVEDLFKVMDKRTEEMIVLKNKIMQANIEGNMFLKILQLGELKGEMELLKSLDPKEGSQVGGYGEKVLSYKTQMSIAEKNDLIQECQGDVDELTDELDEFNASTEIEI